MSCMSAANGLPGRSRRVQVWGGGQVLRYQGLVTDDRRRFCQSADKPGTTG